MTDINGSLVNSNIMQFLGMSLFTCFFAYAVARAGSFQAR